MEIKGEGTVRFAVWAILSVIMWKLITPFEGGMEAFMNDDDVLSIFFSTKLYFALFKVGLLLWIADSIAGTIYITAEWERVAIFRLGKFERMAGPGVFFILPFLWSTKKLDMRLMVIPIEAAQTLTSDDVTVDANGVAYVQIDPKHPEWSITKVKDAMGSVTEAAQAALKDGIGSHTLHVLMTDRKRVGETLRASVSDDTDDWGMMTVKIKIKDVVIPKSLQDTMSRAAQADREVQARLRLAEAEEQAARLTVAAAKLYVDTPGAMELRLANMAYEVMSQGHNHLMVVPTMMMDAMGGAGNLLGMASRFGQDRPDGTAAEPVAPAGQTTGNMES